MFNLILGLGSRLALLTDIIRTINDGKNSLELVTEHLSSRPMVLGSDIIALVPLGIKFGFIDGNEKNLRITKQGLYFMNYIDNTAQEISNLASPTDEDYATLDKKLKDIGIKYKKQNGQSEVYNDIQGIRSIVSKYVNFAPEISTDFELLLTASMPPGLGEKIPLQLKGMTVLHDEAIKKVIRDATEELIISSPFLEIGIFKLLVGNINTEKLSCKILTSDKDRIKNNSYNLNSLKSFLDSHFLDSEICYLRKDGFISHAKMWLSEKSVHITSANILTNSQTDNFELGIYSTNKFLVDSCRTLIKKVWKLGEPL